MDDKKPITNYSSTQIPKRPGGQARSPLAVVSMVLIPFIAIVVLIAFLYYLRRHWPAF